MLAALLKFPIFFSIESAAPAMSSPAATPLISGSNRIQPLPGLPMRWSRCSTTASTTPTPFCPARANSSCPCSYAALPPLKPWMGWSATATSTAWWWQPAPLPTSVSTDWAPGCHPSTSALPFPKHHSSSRVLRLAQKQSPLRALPWATWCNTAPSRGNSTASPSARRKLKSPVSSKQMPAHLGSKSKSTKLLTPAKISASKAGRSPAGRCASA